MPPCVELRRLPVWQNQSMTMTPPETLLQARVPEKVRRAAEQLFSLLYADVSRLAHRERSRVRAGETLRTTALINEAYLKLLRSPEFNDRAHFLRSAALAMRHILVNHARDRVAAKRGGGVAVESLDEAVEAAAQSDDSVIEVHEAVDRLAQLDERLAQVVECRFFAGYTEQDTATALGMTERTIRRDWAKARAWLRVELGASGEGRKDDTGS
jgi:RNA polymerase sigma factor (TIGR02999 family)